MNPPSYVSSLHHQWVSASGEGMTMELVGMADGKGRLETEGHYPLATFCATDDETIFFEIYPKTTFGL